MAQSQEFHQEQAVLSHRVTVLEAKVDKIDATQDTIQLHVTRIADAIDQAARERKEFQRDVQKNFRCMTDTWDRHVAENGPLLTELKRSRDEREAMSKKAKLAAVGLVVAAAWQWGVDLVKWVFKIKTGG